MKTLKITLASILLLTLSVVNAQTKGSGNVTTENREISGFNIIKVGCAIHLFISQGAQ
jgi:hypothetical protein